jgi:3D (Asp-Asp-Asp) domain-containing protein
MRKKILFCTIVALLLMLGLSARAGTAGVSSKSLFSKGVTAPCGADLGDSETESTAAQGRLARVTAYWPGEDYYTNRRLSATGVRLRDGFCAVDSSIIPYGSVVKIPGVGDYIAMDTGTAVISRKAAKESGHTRAERSALVIDLYFASRRAGELFTRMGPKFAMVAWESGAGAGNRE